MDTTQRLYRLGFNTYVQHDGTSELPAEVQAHCQQRRIESPPYICLPRGPVTFRVAGYSPGRGEVTWDGVSTLPEPVLRYVCENGVLPLGQVFREEADEDADSTVA